ncbi:MAG: PAS domain S-box protein [Syntrophales bacterium]|nr:PAS domain S-box protein [Syntrophales bacterium]
MITRVLIVDDNSTSLYMLESLLKGYGMEVTAAENGKDALEKARLNPPDLIVTDILMPVMDGYALCRQWKSDETLKPIPLVFYTATYTEPKDEAFALSLGADRFILKPQEPDIFMNMLKEVFEEGYSTRQAATKPLGEEMEFFRRHNEILFNKLEKKMLDLETANQRLRASEERYRLSFEYATDVICTVGADLIISTMSPSIQRLMGLKPQDFIGRPVSDLKKFLAPKSFEQIMVNIHRILQGEIIPSATYEFLTEKGTAVYSEISGSPITRDGKIVGMISVARDVTERMRTDAALQESELLFRKVFEDHAAVKLIIDPDTGNIIDVNKAAVVFYGWSSEQLKQMKIQEINTLAPEEVKKEMEKVRAEKRIHFEFRHRRADGSVRDVDVFSSKIKVNKKDLLHSIVYDITARKQAEEKLKDTLESLRKAVETTIQVMVSTVETRDPYTAGHQFRSADLARAIATEIGLPQEKTDGIFMAGSIHDIGKLSIPAEILSKPAKLTNTEFSLIKEHPLKGCEILKNVESPWPLAEIVYEHHERMNGSGYPRNLKGNKILIEARILAVADVVEAMASHRPYRPARGVDAALDEIARNRDILYDPEVVDACLRLFHEKGYKFQ